MTSWLPSTLVAILALLLTVGAVLILTSRGLDRRADEYEHAIRLEVTGLRHRTAQGQAGCGER